MNNETETPEKELTLMERYEMATEKMNELLISKSEYQNSIEMMDMMLEVVTAIQKKLKEDIDAELNRVNQ